MVFGPIEYFFSDFNARVIYGAYDHACTDSDYQVLDNMVHSVFIHGVTATNLYAQKKDVAANFRTIKPTT